MSAQDQAQTADNISVGIDNAPVSPVYPCPNCSSETKLDPSPGYRCCRCGYRWLFDAEYAAHAAKIQEQELAWASRAMVTAPAVPYLCPNCSYASKDAGDGKRICASRTCRYLWTPAAT